MGQRWVEGKGAGVRDRRSKNKRVDWREKRSEDRGRRGGWEAQGGQEEDREVLYIKR